MRRSIIVLLVVSLAVSAACDNENGGSDGNGGGDGATTSVTIDDVVEPTRPVDVGCAIRTVGTGGPGATDLTAIEDCGEPIPEEVRLSSGGRIGVDPSGEAWVTLAQETNCGILYVFHSTELTVSDAQPGSTAVASVTTGSIGWANECTGELAITTPSGTVTISGTWVSITYRPERDLSVFVVFDGVAEVAPADDPGAAATAEAGSFVYTTSDDSVSQETGLPAGEPLPVEELVPFAGQLGLVSSLGSIAHRVEVDGISAGPLQQLASVNVRAGGGPLDDVFAQEALTFGLDWASAAPLLLTEQLGALTALYGPSPGFDLSFAQFSPERAQALLEEAGFGEVVVPLLFAERDIAAIDALDIFAMEPFLIVEPTLVADDAEALNLFAEFTAEGVPAIWIGRS